MSDYLDTEDFDGPLLMVFEVAGVFVCRPWP